MGDEPQIRGLLSLAFENGDAVRTAANGRDVIRPLRGGVFRDLALPCHHAGDGWPRTSVLCGGAVLQNA